MDLQFACAVCGMDPATDGLVVQAAVAAAIATPWYLRSRLVSMARAVRRRLHGAGEHGAGEHGAGESCPLPEADDPS